MKKILSFAVFALLTTALFAQDSTVSTTTVIQPVKKEKMDLSNRANDHFMVQLGYTKWSGIPDTINTAGLSKSIKISMLFRPFYKVFCAN